MAVAVVHSGGGGGGRRWWWWGSRDKSILIGAKVEIMTKLTQGTSRVPSLSLSSFSPALILLLLLLFLSIRCNTTGQARKQGNLYTARKMASLYIHTQICVTFFFPLPLPRPVFYYFLFLLLLSLTATIARNIYLVASHCFLPSFHYSWLLPSQHREQYTKQSEEIGSKDKKKKKTCPIE